VFQLPALGGDPAKRRRKKKRRKVAPCLLITSPDHRLVKKERERGGFLYSDALSEASAPSADLSDLMRNNRESEKREGGEWGCDAASRIDDSLASRARRRKRKKNIRGGTVRHCQIIHFRGRARAASEKKKEEGKTGSAFLILLFRVDDEIGVLPPPNSWKMKEGRTVRCRLMIVVLAARDSR